MTTQPNPFDRYYGGKQLGDMRLDEVEQALRDARNEAEQIKRDALHDAEKMIRARDKSEWGRIIHDLLISTGFEDAMMDVFFLEGIVEEFKRVVAKKRW